MSFEKLPSEVKSLDGGINIPSIIGELTPMALACMDIKYIILEIRPKDIYRPIISNSTNEVL